MNNILYYHKIKNSTTHQLKVDLRNLEYAVILSDRHEVEGDDKYAEKLVKAVTVELRKRGEKTLTLPPTDYGYMEYYVGKDFLR